LRRFETDLRTTLASSSIVPTFIVNKKALVTKIIASLDGELALYAKAARAAHAEATHEQSKAESKYDTRGLEASYLARGQSRQAAEVGQAIHEFESLTLRKFGPKEAIDLTAVVELEAKSERSFYFIGPRAGGTEIIHEKKEVLVITPQSPLGQQLLGKKQGDRLQFELGGLRNDFQVVSVS
jgi:transcription elongation GreA/GreB family factor